MNRHAVIYFILALAAIMVYGLLDPAYLPFPKCPLRSLTGWLCPGCGSQRAIHQVLHGRFGNAFQLNALFIPAVLYAFSGYGIALFAPAQWPRVRERWFGKKAAYVSLAIILVFWVGRNMV